MIVTILNDSFLEDLGSTNGTLVNGQPIKKHFLQNNDVIELGKYKLKYVNDAAGQTTAPQDFEKTMVLRPGRRAEARAAPAPATSASQAMPTMSTSQPSPAMATSQPVRPAAPVTQPPPPPPPSASQPMAAVAGGCRR